MQNVELSLRMIIHNLHSFISCEYIISALSELRNQFTNVHNIMHVSNKSPLTLFFFDLKKKTNNFNLQKIEFLLYTKIIFEKLYTPKTPPQCHRCLFFGHIQGYRNQIYRCIMWKNTDLAQVCNFQQTLLLGVHYAPSELLKLLSL